jgi:CBS domain-containing protein
MPGARPAHTFAVRSHRRQEHSMDMSAVPQLPRLDQIPVEQVMHAGLVGCVPEAPISVIARIFAEERIHCVTVNGIERTREGERLTWGIINDRDLMRALDTGDGGLTAGELAVPAQPTIDVYEPLDRAIQLMASYDVAHVIVVEKGYPIGIVSAMDVAAAAGSV